MQKNILGLVLLSSTFALGGCGIFENSNKTPIDLGAVGPRTKDQLKTVPDGLLPDEENSLHTSQELRGDENPN